MQKMAKQTDYAVLLKACLLLCSVLAIVVFAYAAFTPVFPETGKQQIKSGKVTIDVSHADQGYIMVKHSGSKKKLKVSITYGKEKAINYDLNGQGEYEVYPLVSGNGKYKITVYENVSTNPKSTGYDVLTAKSIEVKMGNPAAAFLCPNQQVWYTATAEAVRKSQEICAGITDDAKKVDAIFKYVSESIVYDYIKAVTVQLGYLPDVDETLATSMGICFDYSALLACMLRVQGIPTQLVKGDLIASGNVQKHAWNMVYVGNKWVIKDATFGNKSYKDTDYVVEARF